MSHRQQPSTDEDQSSVDEDEQDTQEKLRYILDDEMYDDLISDDDLNGSKYKESPSEKGKFKFDAAIQFGQFPSFEGFDDILDFGDLETINDGEDGEEKESL